MRKKQLVCIHTWPSRPLHPRPAATERTRSPGAVDVVSRVELPSEFRLEPFSRRMPSRVNVASAAGKSKQKRTSGALPAWRALERERERESIKSRLNQGIAHIQRHRFERRGSQYRDRISGTPTNAVAKAVWNFHYQTALEHFAEENICTTDIFLRFRCLHFPAERDKRRKSVVSRLLRRGRLLPQPPERSAISLRKRSNGHVNCSVSGA